MPNLPSSMTVDTPKCDKRNGAPQANASESKSWKVRGVQWRVKLGVLPSNPAPIDELRRGAADCRRRYAELRRKLLVDPHLMEEGQRPSQSHIDNPLSLDPESIWGRFFRNAELERVIDKDLTRLYPENGTFFQSPACQAMLRRILLVWSLIHPQASYRQGMHELLAPLLYVLHVDLSQLEQIKHRYEEVFDDRFDSLGDEKAFNIAFPGANTTDTASSDSDEAGAANVDIACDLFGDDSDLRVVVLGSDSYGAEGELGALLSRRFLEHDAYGMFDALLSGKGGAVIMADYFLTSTGLYSPVGQPPVLEASASLYRLLAVVDVNLYAHLVGLGVEPQFFALRWLRLLFGREFLLEDLLLIWDAIFSASNTPSGSGGGGGGDDHNNIYDGMKISPRSALISSFAVSMLLYVGPALLAAPDATGCLQRLLNFPQIPDVRPLIENARLLQPVAQSSARNPLPTIFKVAPRKHEKKRIVKQRSGSVSPPTFQGHLALRHQQSAPPCSSPDLLRMSLPEYYWEEKWTHRVLKTVKSGENLSTKDLNSPGYTPPGHMPDSLLRTRSNFDNERMASGGADPARENISSNTSRDQPTNNVGAQINGAQEASIVPNNIDEGKGIVQKEVGLDYPAANNHQSSEGTSVCSESGSSRYKVTLSIDATERSSVSENVREGRAKEEPLFSGDQGVGGNDANKSSLRQTGEAEANASEGGCDIGMKKRNIINQADHTRRVLFATDQEVVADSQSGVDDLISKVNPSQIVGLPPNCDTLQVVESSTTGSAFLQEEGVIEGSHTSPQKPLQAEQDMLANVDSQGPKLTSRTTKPEASGGAIAHDAQSHTQSETQVSEKVKSTPVTTAPFNTLSWVWNLGKSIPADKTGDIITDLQIAASISAPDLLVSKPRRWWVSNGSITTSEASRDNSSGCESNFQESQPKGPGQATRDPSSHKNLPSATRTMKDDGDIIQNANEQVSDLPLETQPVNTENLKGTAEKLLREAEVEEEKEGGFKEPQATNHDRMLTEEGGDVFEKHIVSEIQRHKNVVVLREKSDEMREKQVGSSPLELAKKFNEKGASATLQILGKSMVDHIQVLESAFSQRGPVLDIEQLSRPGYSGRGHVAALVALAELRKISSALQQV